MEKISNLFDLLQSGLLNDRSHPTKSVIIQLSITFHQKQTAQHQGKEKITASNLTQKAMPIRTVLVRYQSRRSGCRRTATSSSLPSLACPCRRHAFAECSDAVKACSCSCASTLPLEESPAQQELLNNAGFSLPNTLWAFEWGWNWSWCFIQHYCTCCLQLRCGRMMYYRRHHSLWRRWNAESGRRRSLLEKVLV